MQDYTTDPKIQDLLSGNWKQQGIEKINEAIILFAKLIAQYVDDRVSIRKIFFKSELYNVLKKEYEGATTEKGLESMIDSWVSTGFRKSKESSDVKKDKFDWSTFKPMSLWDVKKSLPDDYMTRNNFIVDNFLPKGTTFIVSDPKVGKSCFVTQLALSLITGEKLMDTFEVVTKGNVLIFSNEENAASVLTRAFRQGIIDQSILENVMIHDVTKCPISLDEEGLKQIDEIYLKKFNIKYVIVDIWDNQRPSSKARNANAYTVENAQAKPLKVFVAKKLNTPEEVHFIVMHHLNKNDKAKTDFGRISGTQASRGAWDTSMVVSMMDKKTGIYTIEVETRAINCEKIQDDKIIIKRTPELKWAYVGMATKSLGTYTQDNIISIFKDTSNSTMAVSEIAGGLETKFGISLTSNLLAYHLRCMVEKGVLNKVKRGEYELVHDYSKNKDDDPIVTKTEEIETTEDLFGAI